MRIMGVHLSATIAINIQPFVTHDVCQSVVAKTFQLIDNVEVQTKAHDIASKYQILNELFARVHKSIAHALPSAEEEINDLDSDIIRYMDFYRSDIAKQKIIPKQHILEFHSTDFILLWKFGLGFLVSREEKRRMLLSTNSKLG